MEAKQPMTALCLHCSVKSLTLVTIIVVLYIIKLACHYSSIRQNLTQSKEAPDYGICFAP